MSDDFNDSGTNDFGSSEPNPFSESGQVPPPSPYQAPPPGMAPQPTNGMGVAGFIISLCGLACAIGFPIGLILSLIGLRREPKGFAIAGTIIGAIGTAGLLIVALIYGAMLGGCALCAGVGAAIQIPIDNTHSTIMDAKQAIDEFQTLNGRLPTEEEAEELIGDMTDGWDNKLRYEIDGEEYDIRSAGPNGLFDDFDDIDIDEATPFEMSIDDFPGPDTDMPMEEVDPSELPGADSGSYEGGTAEEEAPKFE